MTLRLQARRNLTSRLCAVSGVTIIVIACCASCGTTNNCPSNANSSSNCIINDGNGGSAPNPAPSADLAPGSPADGSPADGSPSDGSPPGGSPSGGSPPASVASGPLVTYIGNLEETPDSEPYDTQGVAQVNGISYTDALGAQFCFGNNERKWTYVLGRKYSSFQGTIGLSDDSVATAEIRFQIFADGRLVYSKDLHVGQSAALDVPVTNVLQVELDTILLTQDGGCGAATGEWADMHAVGP